MAVVLCDLEGLAQEQAARQLGWLPGTVRSRLARGRERSRDRLSRRGLAPAIVPVGAALARDSVPVSLTAIAIENALRFGAGYGVTDMTPSIIAIRGQRARQSTASPSPDHTMNSPSFDRISASGIAVPTSGIIGIKVARTSTTTAFLSTGISCIRSTCS